MTTFRKFLLIEPEKYKKLIERNEIHTSNENNDILAHPNIKTVKKIDKQMTNILNNNQTDDNTKMEKYNSLLERFLRNFHNALEVSKRDAILGNKTEQNSIQTKSVSPEKKPTEELPETNKLSDIMKTIPRSYQNSAKRLFGFIEKNPNFQIKDGTLKYKDGEHFSSDVSELLSGVVRSKKLGDNPRSTVDLLAALKEEGYPIHQLASVRKQQRSRIPVVGARQSRITRKEKLSRAKKQKIFEQWEEV